MPVTRPKDAQSTPNNSFHEQQRTLLNMTIEETVSKTIKPELISQRYCKCARSISPFCSLLDAGTSLDHKKKIACKKHVLIFQQ